MLVSIVIPLYNKEEYFERCFNSVLKQTYKYIECIIVEDCSTDKSAELAEYLITSYTGNINFSLVKHMHNRGHAAARNTGIHHSQGDYIYHLDSDDAITENCISSLVALLEKYIEVDIVQGNTYRVPLKNDGSNGYDFKGSLPEFIKGNIKIKYFYYHKRFPINSWNKLIKKSFITQNNLYFKPGFIHEDQFWTFFALKYIKTFAFTAEYCYIHYIEPNSITTGKKCDFSRSITAHLMIAESMLSNLDIVFLAKNLFRAHKMLNRAKAMILSNSKYLHFLPEYKTLKKKIPNPLFFLTLVIFVGLKEIKNIFIDIYSKLKSCKK